MHNFFYRDRWWPLIVAIALSSMLAQCGGGGAASTAENGAPARLTVSVLRASSTHPLGRVARYRVRVQSPEAPPLEAWFDGAATRGELPDLPAGNDREVFVDALNASEQIVQAGEVRGVTVSSGDTTEVPVALEQVPIFTNLVDGATIINTRLQPEILADSTSSVALLQQSLHADAGAETPLLDVAAGSLSVPVDPVTGLVRWHPARLAPGRYRIEVRDQTTQRHSSVELTIVDGVNHHAAPLGAAGSARPTQLGRLGRLVAPTTTTRAQ